MSTICNNHHKSHVYKWKLLIKDDLSWNLCRSFRVVKSKQFTFWIFRFLTSSLSLEVECLDFSKTLSNLEIRPELSVLVSTLQWNFYLFLSYPTLNWLLFFFSSGSPLQNLVYQRIWCNNLGWFFSPAGSQNAVRLLLSLLHHKAASLLYNLIAFSGLH